MGIGFVRADLEKAREWQVRVIEPTQKAPSRTVVMEIRDASVYKIPLDEFDYKEEFLKPKPVGETSPVPLYEKKTPRKPLRWGLN